MHPVLFEIFGFKLYAFGVLVALAFIMGLFWMLSRAKSAGEDTSLYMDAYCWIIISALLGARLCYLVFFPDQFLADPLGSLFSQGGLVWYGGMIGVCAAIYFFTQFKKLSLWKFTDIIAPPAALGLAIGRIGCLLAGCCYGGPCTTPWAIHYPLDHPTAGAGVYPTPLMESLAMVGVTILLSRVYRHQRFPGQTTSLFFICYAIIRFTLEYLRGDRLVWIEPLNLSASQLISLGGLAVGAILWQVLKAHHQKKQTVPTAPPVSGQPV
jgi:phosphatidylglycerol:prolipoprotein diacylglycerol transferase